MFTKINDTTSHTDRCIIQRRWTTHGHRYFVWPQDDEVRIVKREGRPIASGLFTFEAALEISRIYEQQTA